MASESTGWRELSVKLAELGFPLIGKALIGLVPGVGGIISSFGGGELAGRLAANVLAKVLGVEPTPEAITEAIEGGDTTEVVEKLRTVEGEAKARWGAVEGITVSDNTAEVAVAKINAESSARISEDMAKNDKWLSMYRPILMYASTANLMVIFGVIKYALVAVLFGDQQPIAALATDGVWQLLTLDTGIAGTILGWHFFTRGQERKAAVSAPAAAAAAAAANAVVVK